MFGWVSSSGIMLPSMTDAPRPAIVVVSGTYADQLAEEFGRYARDYEIAKARSVDEAISTTMSLTRRGAQVAMFVSDSRLPDSLADMLRGYIAERTIVRPKSP